MKDRREEVREFFRLIDKLSADGYVGNDTTPGHIKTCEHAFAKHFSTGDHVFWCEEHKVYTTEDSSG
jgi:hypothetical protein